MDSKLATEVAKLQVSEETGHSRTDIMTAYSGGSGRRKPDVPLKTPTFWKDPNELRKRIGKI